MPPWRPWAAAVLVAALSLTLTTPGAAEQGATGVAPGGTSSQPPPDADVVPDQYIVVFNDDVSDVSATATSLVDQHRAGLRHVYDSALKGFSAHMSAEEAAELAANPAVASVQPNRTFSVRQEVQPDPPEGLDRIDERDLPLDDEYSYTHTGNGVDIYIMDSGIRTTHDDFGGRATVGEDFVGDGQDGQDCLGHGTHVAGIAGGEELGVAKDANLIAVRIADCAGAGFQDNFLAGLEWIVDNHDGPSVVNMSFGWTVGDDPSPEEEAVQVAVAEGIVFAGATVNEDANRCADDFPSRVEELIAVSNSMVDDAVNDGAGFGPCIDTYAPGTDILSAGIADDDESVEMTGTSMATPHVAGVAALVLEESPSASPATVMSEIVTNATTDHLTKDGGGLPVETPNRLLFSRFLPTPQEPPLADPGGPYSGDEGSAIAFDGSGSSDPSGGALSFQWDFGDGTTGTGATPTHTYLDNGTYTVTLTVTGGGGLSDSATTTASVSNVAPTLTIDPDQVTSVPEGDTLTVTAQFSDPGILDEPFTADVDWGAPAGQEGEEGDITVTVTDPGGVGVPLQGVVTATYIYGDNDDGSGFPVSVTLTDKDGGSDSDGFVASASNVNPAASITSDLPTIGGVPTVVGRVGEPVTIESLVDDPGSDDLTLTWDLGDGTTSTEESLVNPPDADPLPSPTVQPRSVPADVTHTYEGPCLYEATLTATDDDGGTGSTTVVVLITGDAEHPLPPLLWLVEYANPLPIAHIDDETLQCYLEITNHISEMYDEVRPLEDSYDAVDALTPPLPLLSERTDALDRELLAAWLNFAHGPYTLDELIDTDRDREPDTEFWTVLQTAEDVRLDPDSTDAELFEQTRLLARVNNGCAPPSGGLLDTLRCAALELVPPIVL